MALTRPTLLNTAPFDATQSHVFNFTQSGSGSQIVGNILTILRNDTLEQVYSEEQTTFAYGHLLLSNTLSNGVVYQATLETIGADGSQSVASVPIIFSCIATPTFQFSNLPSGNTIKNNSYSFDLLYNQANGEALNSATFNLYSVSGALLSTSGVLNGFDTIPVTVSYLFSGFQDNTEYYIEAIGQTVNGMSLSTGRIKLVSIFDTSSVYSAFTAVNNCHGGYITITSAVIAIDGESNPSPPTYIDNSAVDLREDVTWVKYDSGYQITGNFLAAIWISEFNANTTIFQMSDTNGNIIKVDFKTDNGTQYYLELTVTQNGLSYVQDSAVVLNATTGVTWVLLRRINNLYQVRGVGGQTI